MCTDCYYRTGDWPKMQKHYKEDHPGVNPEPLFTDEAKYS